MNTQESHKFEVIFNIIFNKIPYIYSELFLKIFDNNYFYLIYQDNTYFESVLKRIFNNYYQKYDYSFFYKNIIVDFKKFGYDDLTISILTKHLSLALTKNIASQFLNDLANKSNHLYFDYDRLKLNNKYKNISFKIFNNYLIALVLVETIKILNNYTKNPDINFRNYIKKVVANYQTWELNLDNINDDYNKLCQKNINKIDYTNLVFLLMLSQNGKAVTEKINYNIDKIFQSISYSTSVRKLIDYKKGYEYLEKISFDNIKTHKIYPFIYTNISEILHILFKKYHDNYQFLIDKELILKKIFYLYIKNVNLENKIFLSNNYKVWSYEWDSLAKFYFSEYN